MDSARDASTIIDVTRCVPNGAVLSKSLRVKLMATAVSLLNNMLIIRRNENIMFEVTKTLMVIFILTDFVDATHTQGSTPCIVSNTSVPMAKPSPTATAAPARPR